MLRAFGQLDLGLAAERRHLDRAAERRARHADRHRAMEIVAISLEDVVRLHADLDVEIAVRAAVRPRLAVAARADPHALVDAGRNLDLERLVLLEAALAVAGRARLGDELAAAVAGRAGLLDAEEALAHLHRSGAVAGRAADRARSRLGAVALAGLAGLVRRDADLRFLAVRRFLERDLHRVAEVAAAVDLLAARGAAAAVAEDVAEDVAERLGEAAEALGAAAPEVGVDPGVAVLVVGGTLLSVGEHLVGFLRLLEAFLGFLRRRTLVAVRVVLHRQLAISLLDLFLGSVTGDAEHLVVVALACCHRRSLPRDSHPNKPKPAPAATVSRAAPADRQRGFSPS